MKSITIKDREGKLLLKAVDIYGGVDIEYHKDLEDWDIVIRHDDGSIWRPLKK